MSDILTGIVKGLSGFMPQDDPDVKIFNAQTELKELSAKMEKVYARLGRQVYEADGGAAYPDIKTELDGLALQRNQASERLTAAKNEKAERERVAAEERARREAEELQNACPNCGSTCPEGSKFCQSCGTRLERPETVAKRFCQNCGSELVAGHRFCQSCGTKAPE